MDAIEEKLRGICQSAITALQFAHRMICRTVEGKSFEFNDLENYFCSITHLIEDTGLAGTLIDGALTELDEFDWLGDKLEIQDGALHLVKDEQP